jgi:hypothetical protein
MNTGRKFPALRIVEDKMTNDEIKHIFNLAFGGWAVEKVTKGKKYRTIHIDQGNEQRQWAWDEFYEELDEYGGLWIYIDKHSTEEDFDEDIKYLTYPEKGFWEVHYAKKTAPRRSDCQDPRVGEDGKVRRNPTRPWPPLPPPKRCTCGCTCGARLGTAF